MILRSRYFRRLFLPYLVLITLATGATGFIGTARLRATYLKEQEHRLRDEAKLVYSMIEPEIRKGPPEGLSARLGTLGQILGCRITLVAEDGRVLADTSADPARMDNHRLRPEIVEAAGSGEGLSIRRSDTLDAEMMYLARHEEAGGPYLRLALPLVRLSEELWTLYLGLGVATGLAVVAAGTLCFHFARRNARPLLELTRMADALSRGDFDRRSLVESADEAGSLAQALNAMADSLSHLVSQVARDKQELVTILEAMNEGVIATDREQRLFLANRAASEQFGFSARGLQGKALWEVLREESILKAAPEVLLSGTRARVDVGPLQGRLFEVLVCPLPADSAPEGLLIVSYEVTESRKYDRLRRDFVANVSHELRTPLSVIKGFVETLQDGALGDPVKGPQFLAIVQKHVVQLVNLVNDLLDLSSLESRPDLPRRQSVDLREAVRKVAELMKPVAARKRQDLQIEASESPLPVDGDPDYLERAVSNLVDNAIKYTPDGGRIRVSTRRLDSAVVLEVVDNGIGIPAEDLPRIFERFYRVDKSRSRDMGGTGLGLSIVKHVVHAHGGTVEATSQLGRGSTFRITLRAGTLARSASALGVSP